VPTKAPSSPFGRRRRWTEQEAREVLASLRRSGKPVSVFAAEQGLDRQRLYSWRRRLGKAEPNTFQELIVRQSPRSSVVGEDAAFEVALPSGVTVRVPASFDAAALERLLEVLQARAC
jgi:transposase-like protein